MEEVVIYAITYLALILCIWAGWNTFISGRIMLKVYKLQRPIRTKDKISFIMSLTGFVLLCFVVFVWPGLILMIPSTTLYIELMSIPLFIHLSHTGIIHLRRVNQCQNC